METTFNGDSKMNTDIIEEIVYGTLKLPPKGELYDLSDMHIPEHNRDKLKAIIRHISHKPKNRFITMGGDNIDAYLLNGFANKPRRTLQDIEGELQMLMEITKPILSQITSIHFGNHEERLFKGVKQGSPDVLTGIFSYTEKIKEENPNVIVAPLGRGIRLDVLTEDQTYKIYQAHSRGHKRYMYWTEFDRAMALFPNQDVFLFRHSHEYNAIIHRYIKPNNTMGRALYVRCGAYTPYLPYMEKMLLPPSDVGSVILKFNHKYHSLPKVDFTGNY